jgi:branched-chain amino acid transport system ATP-binding protein
VLLELDGLASGYGRALVLDGVSLQVDEGEIVALVGANGAGKSTLLNTVMGLVDVRRGDIRFDGQSIVRRATSAIVRAGIAQVPERRQLFGEMTVAENLRLGAYACSDRTRIAETLEEQFERFPILRERHRQAAGTLSGGEQQMVAIARAAMSRPRLLLLDEPSLGLAPIIVAQIMDQILAFRSSGGTVFVVEQNVRAALEIADRGYVIENGRIILSGRASELLGSPAVQDAYLGGKGAAPRAIESRLRALRRDILER